MKAITTAFVMAVCLPAHAMHPLTTEDTGTQGAGRYQLELVTELERDRTGDATTRTQLPEAVLAWGATDTLDLILGSGHLRLATQDAGQRTVQKGLIDTTLGLKWRFYEVEGLSLGLLPALTLPTGDDARGTGTGRITYGSLLIVSWEAEPHGVHLHVGYQRMRNTAGERVSRPEGSAAYVFMPTPKWRLAVEVSREAHHIPGERPIRSTGAGAVYAASKRLDLDAGVRRSLDAGTVHRTLLAGVTLRW